MLATVLRPGLGALSAAVVLTTTTPSPVLLFRLTDPRLTEASGLAVGIAQPGVLYVQNDSGDAARFFAVDGGTGVTRAVYAVPEATNVDWEDLAVATDPRAVPSVWLADIGDNQARRSEIRIYRVAEPTDGSSIVRSPDVWRLRYPTGPADAEAIAVSPGGATYIFTKSVGVTTVYTVPAVADPTRVQELRKVGELSFAPTGTPGGPSPIGQLTVTGASLSPDGTVLALRTYTDAYVWWVRDGDVAAALRTPPARVPLPSQPQGEGIAVDGDRLLIDSEGVGAAVYAVALPPAPAPPGSSSTTSVAPASSAAASTNLPSSRDSGWVIGTAAVGAVAVAATAWILRRRHRSG